MLSPRARLGCAACVAGGASLAALLLAWRPHESTVVKLRGYVHLYNWLYRNDTSSDAAWERRLGELLEAALAAERAAFGDDASADAAKRALFRAQLDGLNGPGNRFSALGRALARKDLVATLARRRAFADRCAAAGPLPPLRAGVVVIAGLPRTGSTFLHRLLAVDGATRSPLWWEQMHDDPAPAVSPDDPRAAEVARALRGLAAISPNALAEFDKFHKLGSGEVEECAPFLRRYYNDMDSVLFAPRALDARSRWLRDPAVDKSFLVRHLVAWLRLQNADEAWILKAPLFTYFLDELEAALPPSTTFAFTSRDPRSVVPSTCGMAEVSAALKADWTTPHFLHLLGESVADRLAAWAGLQADFAARRPDAVRVAYDDLVADPLAVVERIYAAAGRTLTPETRAAMDRHLAENRQHKHGRAAYSLAKFGLADLSRFDAYAATFL